MKGSPIINKDTGKIWYSYRDYLQSDEWKRKTDHVKTAGKYRCKCCRSGKDLEVHHKTYRSIGNESINDLIILCRACHKLHHASLIDYDKPPKWARIGKSHSEVAQSAPYMSKERERHLNRFRSIL